MGINPGTHHWRWPLREPQKGSAVDGREPARSRRAGRAGRAGGRRVAAGANLKIKNKANPRQVGPHTFSLVKEKELPTTNSQIKKCSKKLKLICGAIVAWHDVDVQTGEIGENPVAVGKNGWDHQGGLKEKGDSWVAEKKGAVFTREVTAKPGKVLHFICAVHAEMQGEITVLEG